MKLIVKAGLATAALATLVAGVTQPAAAADLGGRGGSIKDAPAPMAMPAPAAGPCYFRADTGYAWSRDPDVDWTVTDVNGNFKTDNVRHVSMQNTWFGEAGIGCGSGSRGLRGEFVLGYHGDRKIVGEPGVWRGVQDDPLHTSVASYTAMFNAYYDLGRWHSVTPYVGAGLGAAYNIVGETYFTANPHLTNRIEGKSDLSLAWSLMAGVGYQLSNRAILDIGYRYIDLGSARSGRVDSAGFVNPPVRIDDIAAHEFKVGIRWHFGAADCCAQSMK